MHASVHVPKNEDFCFPLLPQSGLTAALNAELPAYLLLCILSKDRTIEEESSSCWSLKAKRFISLSL